MSWRKCWNRWMIKPANISKEIPHIYENNPPFWKFAICCRNLADDTIALSDQTFEK